MISKATKTEGKRKMSEKTSIILEMDELPLWKAVVVTIGAILILPAAISFIILAFIAVAMFGPRAIDLPE